MSIISRTILWKRGYQDLHTDIWRSPQENKPVRLQSTIECSQKNNKNVSFIINGMELARLGR